MPRGRIADTMRSAALGATFGMAAKPMAFLDVLGPKGDDTRSFGERYQAALKAERGAQEEFAGQNPKTNIGIQLAAGLAPAVLSGGAGAAGDVGTVARLDCAAGHAGAIGAAAGAVNSDGDIGDRALAALREGAVGAAMGGAFTGAGQLVGKGARVSGLSDMLSKVSTKLGQAVEGSPAWTNLKGIRDKIAAQLESLGGATGARGEGAQLVSERVAGDAKGGVQLAADDVPGVEKLGVHYGGPEVQSLAQGVLRDKGGRTQLRSAIEKNAAEQRPALANALTAATDMEPGLGTKPLRAALVEKKQADDAAYDLARAANPHDEPLDSPEFDELIKTPSGSLSYNRAKNQVADRGRPVPTREEVTMHDPPTPPGVSDEKWQQFLDDIRRKGLPIPGAVEERVQHEVPNAEVAHVTKQQLARLSRLGVHDTQAGAHSSDANARLGLWQKTREVLKPEWKAADEIASEGAQRVEAMRAGMNIFNTKEIPPSPSIQIKTAKGQLGKSLEQITANVKAASPEVQQKFQQGAGNAAQQLLRSAPRSMSDPADVFLRSDQRIEQLKECVQVAGRFRALQGDCQWDERCCQVEPSAHRRLSHGPACCGTRAPFWRQRAGSALQGQRR